MSTRHSNLNAQQLGQCFNCDIAIIGGGPVGASLALALRESGLRVCVLETRALQDLPTDPRGLALSYGSRLLLQRLGVWNDLPDVCAIRNIHISQRQTLGRAVLRADALKLPALGYVLPYVALQNGLQRALQASKVHWVGEASVTRLQCDADAARIYYTHASSEQVIEARLAVVADGGRLLEADYPPEVRDYGQSALIAHVTCTQPLMDTAFERFTAQGPVALLPYQDGYEAVWTASHETMQEMQLWDEATFLARLQQHFGGRVGTFTHAGTRTCFPLRLKLAPQVTLPHAALIGNAAQTLHPVAGQGFNLGLRDAWELAQGILSWPPANLGDAAMLEHYRKAREFDRTAGARFTDGLVRLFSNDMPLISAGRAAALSVLDCLPPLKRFVARRMMFGAHG